MKLAAITALYDIGRETSDGRTMDHYIGWLNETLRVPLPFIVFVDPSFDAGRISLKRGDSIVRVPKNELSMFAYRSKVEQILASGQSVTRRDLTFSLPDYGMLVMSKFDLMKRATHMADADYFLWVDAGLSRFLPALKNASVRRSIIDMGETTILLNTSYYLSQRQRIGKLPHKSIGSAMAFVSAGDFLVECRFVEELEARLRFMVETEWLPESRWDNEQVALGCLLFRGGLPGARVVNTDVASWASVTRWLFGDPAIKGSLKPNVLSRLLRDEFRIRMAPTEQCYLPGDFPENRYREWIRCQ